MKQESVNKRAGAARRDHGRSAAVGACADILETRENETVNYVTWTVSASAGTSMDIERPRASARVG